MLKHFSYQKSAPVFTDLYDRIISTQYSSDTDIYEKELKDLYDRWIISLPEKRRLIFQMYYNDELSTSEIAARLNISQKTVQNHLGMAANDFHEKLIMSTYLLIAIKEILK